VLSPAWRAISLLNAVIYYALVAFITWIVSVLVTFLIFFVYSFLWLQFHTTRLQAIEEETVTFEYYHLGLITYWNKAIWVGKERVV
jgi:hypothetical protein